MASGPDSPEGGQRDQEVGHRETLLEISHRTGTALIYKNIDGLAPTFHYSVLILILYTLALVVQHVIWHDLAIWILGLTWFDKGKNRIDQDFSNASRFCPCL